MMVDSLLSNPPELAKTWPEVVSQIVMLLKYAVPAIVAWFVPRPQDLIRMVKERGEK